MKGEIDNRTILVGNSVLMENEGVALGQSKRIGNQEMDKGRTIVYVALDEQVIGMISLADRVRGEAPEVIKELKDNNLHISMLTGDNFKTAEGLSSLLNIDSFEAEIRPEQKKLIVESLRRVGNMVAMVGDGINDAPALAEANIAVAIGSGTDVAIEVADVVLSKSDLNSIRKMFQISKISKKVIRQNLFWAFFYNILAIPLAAGLFYPFFGISLTPMIAAITMSFSSVLVVLNSLRLKNVPLR